MDMPVGAVFTGEIQRVEEQDVVYISGALQMKDLEIKGTDILVGQEVWEQAEKEREEYFPELKIVGWCLVETGHPMGLSRSVNKIHGKVFGEENTIFVWKDAAEAGLDEEDFYIVEKGDTLDSISIKIYGDASHVEAICKMNGLTDGNLIFIGQKLLLP